MKCKYTWDINSNGNAITASWCSNIMYNLVLRWHSIKIQITGVHKNFSLGDLGLAWSSPKRVCGKILGTLLTKCNQVCCILSVLEAQETWVPRGIAPPMLIMPLIPLRLYNKVWVINSDTSQIHTAPNWLISLSLLDIYDVFSVVSNNWTTVIEGMVPWSFQHSRVISICNPLYVRTHMQGWC